MIRLTRLIEARGFTQSQAARLLAVTQPRISDLVRGKIDRFSVDSLIEMLGRTGARIALVVKLRRRVEVTGNAGSRLRPWFPASG